jgi:23S rRNA-/tRNA-specific pseudouridylate synthase
MNQFPPDTTTTTIAVEPRNSDVQHNNNRSDMNVQQRNDTTELDTDRTMVVDESIAEQWNQMGIVRQYEVLVAGHVLPQINATTIIHLPDDKTYPSHNTSQDTTIPFPTTHNDGSGWIDLPLMRCYEYPPYMRISTPEQQQFFLSLDATIVGKQLLEAPKSSLTYYEIMNYEYYQNHTSLPVTRMTLTSMTGRTHQLNVHCTYTGIYIINIYIYIFHA